MATTSMTPTALVAPPGRIPLPYGLFSVVALREGTADRWQGGVTWESLPCEPAGGRGTYPCPPGVAIGLPKSFDVSNETQNADPFTVYGTFKCTPVGWSLDAAQARATAHLLAREEARAEQALWTGDLGNTPNLQDDGVIIGPAGPTTVTAAIARLEGFIATTYGAVGVIHMTRPTATVALADRAVEVRGARLFTALGTPVVAGAGYGGVGPDGTTPGANQAFIYATPALFGYRSEVFTASNVPGDLLDRAVNDLYAVAERTYLLGWDDCGVGAVLVGLPATPPTTRQETTMTQPVWDGTGVPPTTPDPDPDSEAYDPADHTVAEVTAWLDDHPEQTDRVLAAEKAGKARVTLLDYTPPDTPAQVTDTDGNPIAPGPDGLVTLTDTTPDPTPRTQE